MYSSSLGSSFPAAQEEGCRTHQEVTPTQAVCHAHREIAPRNSLARVSPAPSQFTPSEDSQEALLQDPVKPDLEKRQSPHVALKRDRAVHILLGEIIPRGDRKRAWFRPGSTRRGASPALKHVPGFLGATGWEALQILFDDVQMRAKSSASSGSTYSFHSSRSSDRLSFVGEGNNRSFTHDCFPAQR
jgi:hypothetical protein